MRKEEKPSSTKHRWPRERLSIKSNWRPREINKRCSTRSRWRLKEDLLMKTVSRNRNKWRETLLSMNIVWKAASNSRRLSMRWPRKISMRLIDMPLGCNSKKRNSLKKGSLRRKREKLKDYKAGSNERRDKLKQKQENFKDRFKKQKNNLLPNPKLGS